MTDTNESLWDAMERLRLSTIAGLDRLDALVEEAKTNDYH